IVAGKTPIAARIEVAELKDIELAVADLRQRPGDLATDELASAQRRFVVEENAGRRADAIALAIVHGRPVSKQLGDAIGAAWIKRRRLVLGDRLRLAEHLRGRGLEEPHRRHDLADRLENAQRADRGRLGGIKRLLERQPDKALPREVVDLVRLYPLENAHDVGQLGEIEVDELERIDNAQFDKARDRAARRAPQSADDAIPLAEEKLRQVGAVLTAD